MAVPRGGSGTTLTPPPRGTVAPAGGSGVPGQALVLHHAPCSSPISFRPPHRVWRVPSPRSDAAKTKAPCPDSSTWEKPRPALPLNAGAPSSKISSSSSSSDNQDQDPPETDGPNPGPSDGEESCVRDGPQDLNKA
ncbi:unnamed protein product [Boreogadus saida]